MKPSFNPENPVAPSTRPRSVRIAAPFIAALLSLLISAAGAWAGDQTSLRTPDAEPQAVYGTVDEAAFYALSEAHATGSAKDRGRMRAGTIFRVGDGYRFTRPIRSSGTVWSARGSSFGCHCARSMSRATWFSRAREQVVSTV